MKWHDPARYRILDRRERRAIAAVALTASSSLVCALIVLFESASPDVWLTPTSDVVEDLRRCDEMATRQAQQQCKQTLVESRLEAPKRSTHTARRPAPGASRPGA
jgi:hypothetical protein